MVSRATPYGNAAPVSWRRRTSARASSKPRRTASAVARDECTSVHLRWGSGPVHPRHPLAVASPRGRAHLAGAGDEAAEAVAIRPPRRPEAHEPVRGQFSVLAEYASSRMNLVELRAGHGHPCTARIDGGRGGGERTPPAWGTAVRVVSIHHGHCCSLAPRRRSSSGYLSPCSASGAVTARPPKALCCNGV